MIQNTAIGHLLPAHRSVRGKMGTCEDFLAGGSWSGVSMPEVSSFGRQRFGPLRWKEAPRSGLPGAYLGTSGTDACGCKPGKPVCAINMALLGATMQRDGLDLPVEEHPPGG